MRHSRPMTIAMAILWVLSWSPAAWAETLTLTADGEYVMGEGETMAVAGEKARKNAIRAAAEQAGAFVRSVTKVSGFTVQEDVIEVVANHAMKVEVLDEQTELVGKKSLRFRTRIKATISSEEVAANLRKTQEDMSVVDGYRKLQEDYARLALETEALKKKLETASTTDRKGILDKLGTEESRFKANVLYEKASRLSSRDGDLAGAEAALSAAIALNPEFARAYALRGEVRAFGIVSGSIEPALADMAQAIALAPDDAALYMRRADILRRDRGTSGCQGQVTTTCAQVIADMDRAIALAPANAWYHFNKGELLAELARYDEAMAEVDNALRIGGDTFSSNGGVIAAYMKRAQVQQEKGNAAAAIADLDKAVRLADTPLFFTAEDHRTMETMTALFEAESKKRPQTDRPFGIMELFSEAYLPQILAAYSISPAMAEAELPRLMERIQASLGKLFLVAETYHARADARLDAAQYDRAKTDMRAACRWEALNPDPTIGIALCRSKNMEKDLDRQYSPAGRWLKTGQRIQAEWESGGGVDKGNPETLRQALDAYGKSITIDPGNAEAFGARCHLLSRSEAEPWNNKHLQERIVADCAKALKLDSSLLTAGFDLADAYNALGQKEKALEVYAQLVKHHPEARGARQQRVFLLRDLGRLTEAIAEAGAIVRQDPNDTAMLREKAEMCEAAGRLPEALEAWEAYLQHWTARDQEREPGGAPSQETLEAKERIKSLKAKTG